VTTMKAVVYERYGGPEVLQLEEIERPVPKADELLIRVVATTVNRSDCGSLGRPVHRPLLHRHPPSEVPDPGQ